MGLCLIDFRHAVDACQFAEEQQFVGVPPFPNVFGSGQPWKWQLDYHGLVACLVPLIIDKGLTTESSTGSIVRCPQTGHYNLAVKPYK